MRDRLVWFGYGVLFGIFLAGSNVEAVAENLESKARDYAYTFREWRRERDVKRRQNP